MAVHEVLHSLPWSLIIALGSILTVYAVYRRRSDLFDRFGFGTREVTFLTLLPVAGWAINVPFLVLGRSTLALNLGGALVPVLLSGWIVYRGTVRGRTLVVTVVAVAVVAAVSYEIVEFDPGRGIIAVFPWFFLPSLAASGVTLFLLARNDLVSVPAAYIAGSIGALVGADVLHLGEVGPYALASQEVALLSVGGAGALDMVFLAGILAMAANLAVVAAVNPPPRERTEPPVRPFPYPAGLALVRDPAGFIVDIDRRRAAGRFVPLADRVHYHLARADVALDAGQPDRAVAQAREAVRLALSGRGDLGREEPWSHPQLRRDARAVLDARADGWSARQAEQLLTTAKLIVGAVGTRPAAGGQA